MSYQVVVANDISSGANSENLVSAGSDQSVTYQQSFVGTGQPIRRVQFRVKKNVANITGSLSCYIRLANAQRRQTGANLAVFMPLNMNTFSYQNFDWVSLDLPSDFTPVAGTNYVFYLTFGIDRGDPSTWDTVAFEKNQNGLNGVNHDGRSSRYREGYGLDGDLFDSTTTGTPPVSTLNIMFRLLSYPPPLKEAAFSVSLSAQAAFSRQISRIRGFPAALKVSAEKIVDTTPPFEHDLIDSISYLEGGIELSYIVTSDSALSFVSALAQGFTGNGGYVEAAEFYLARRGVSVGEVRVAARIYQSVGSNFASASVGALLAESEPLIFNNLSTVPGWMRFVFAEPIKTVAGQYYFVAIAAVSGNLSNGSVDPRLVVCSIGGPSSELNGGSIWQWQRSRWNSVYFGVDRGVLFRVLGCPFLHLTVLSGFVRELFVFRQAAAYMVLSAGVKRFFAALRNFSVGLNVSAGLRRISTQFRIWSAKTTLWSDLSRQFRVLRQIPASLSAKADLSRFVLALRDLGAKFSLQAALARQFRVLRGFSAKLDVSAALKQLSEMLYGFTAELSLSAAFEALRIPALRVAAFNAGLSVQSGVRRSVVFSRRVVSELGLSAGFNRFLTYVRGFSASAGLVSLFESLRFGAIREAAFSAGFSVQAVLSRQITLTRRILTRISVGAVLHRWVLGVRSWGAKISVVSFVKRQFSSARQFSSGLGLSAGFVRVFRVLRGFPVSVSLEAGFRRFFVYVRGFTASLGLSAVFMRWFGRLRNGLRLFEHQTHPDIVEELLVHPDIVEEEIPCDL